MPSFNVRQFPVGKTGDSGSQPAGASSQIRKFREGQWQIGNWYTVNVLQTGWDNPNSKPNTTPNQVDSNGSLSRRRRVNHLSKT